MKRLVSAILVLTMVVGFCPSTSVFANYYDSEDEFVFSKRDYKELYNEGYDNAYEDGLEDGRRAAKLGSYGAYYNGLADFEVGNSAYNEGAFDGYLDGYEDGFYDYKPENNSKKSNYSDLYNKGYNDEYDMGYEDGRRAAKSGSYGAYYNGLADFEVGNSAYNEGAFDGYLDGYEDGFNSYYPSYNTNSNANNTNNNSNTINNGSDKKVYYSYSSSVSTDVTINGNNYHYENSYQTNDPTESVNQTYEFSVTEQYTPVCDEINDYIPPVNNYGNSGNNVSTSNTSYQTGPTEDLYADIIYYNDFKPKYMDVSKDCESHITALEESSVVRELKKGNMLYITGKCSNKYNNVWYIVNNTNEYIYSKNLQEHKHTMKDVKTEVGNFKVCKNCGYYTVASGSSAKAQKMASTAFLAAQSIKASGQSVNNAIVTGAGLAVSDGTLPIGDVVAVTLVTGALLYATTKILPTVAEIVQTAVSGVPQKGEDGVYRKVQRYDGMLIYVDSEYMDINTAYLYVIAGFDVYCKTYDQAETLAMIDKRGCFSERDKDRPDYYFHFHIGNKEDSNRKRKTYGGHIFYGQTDNGDVPH